MPDRLVTLQTRLGHTFSRPELLTTALTHASYIQDHPEVPTHNQRLEFLGDAVLHFILTEVLYAEFPVDREGVLSRRRAALSKGEFLSHLARDLGLADALLLSTSEEETGGRDRSSILEDALEAIVGAIYLDSDLPTTRRVLLGWYGSITQRLAALEDAENPKGRLQELIQPAHGNSALRYEVVNATGPKHAREYEVAVYLKEQHLGQGRGTSKKIAEEAAARIALTFLRENPQPPASAPAP